MSHTPTPSPAGITASPTSRVVRPETAVTGKQGLSYQPGISAATVGSQTLHMQIVTIPPGGRARAHKHAGHETAVYVLSGHSEMWYGERLEHHLVASAGDFIYIPADVAHLPYNPSLTENCVAVIARTDPNEQESVVLLPELDNLPPRQPGRRLTCVHRDAHSVSPLGDDEPTLQKSF